MSSSSEDALVAKVVSMAVLGLVPFALGVLPARLASRLGWGRGGPDEGKGGRASAGGLRGVSLLLCFGGGVLLCTTFLHLQPEVREGVEALQEAGQLPRLAGVHLSELLLCAGFFLVYLAEELVHAVLDSRHEDEEAAALHRTVSLRRCTRSHASESPAPILPRVTLGPKAAAAPDCTAAAPAPGPPFPAAAAVVSSSSTASSSSSTQVLFSRSSSASFLDVKTVCGPLDAARLSAPAPAPGAGHHRHHHHAHHNHVSYDTLRADSVAASLKGLLAVLALSFHAVFEGLAVGLESDAGSVWVLCGAVAAHKMVIAFCVGVELVSARTRPLLLVAYVATFAMVTPLGIGAGIAVTASQGSGATATATTPAVAVVVLQGMAAGTLLYVVFFEVLQRERSHGGPASGLCHLFAILLGFALMLGLQILSGHEHRHGTTGHQHNHAPSITESTNGGDVIMPTHAPHGGGHEHHDHR